LKVTKELNTAVKGNNNNYYGTPDYNVTHQAGSRKVNDTVRTVTVIKALCTVESNTRMPIG
jgi:hypothetical protein